MLDSQRIGRARWHVREQRADHGELTRHPRKRAIRQPGFRGRIPVADIAVGSGKQDLNDPVAWLPKCWREIGPFLVDGDGVKTLFHAAAQLRVDELEHILAHHGAACHLHVRNAERAHCVPDGDGADRHVLDEAQLRCRVQAEICRLVTTSSNPCKMPCEAALRARL